MVTTFPENSFVINIIFKICVGAYMIYFFPPSFYDKLLKKIVLETSQVSCIFKTDLFAITITNYRFQHFSHFLNVYYNNAIV